MCRSRTSCSPARTSAVCSRAVLRPGSVEQVDDERDREPERRDDADELAAVLVRLRHHRVGEHRQDRAGGERGDERDRAGRRLAEGRVADEQRDTGPSAINVHMPRIRRGGQPPVFKPEVDETASGTLEMKTATRYAADRAALVD